MYVRSAVTFSKKVNHISIQIVFSLINSTAQLIKMVYWHPCFFFFSYITVSLLTSQLESLNFWSLSFWSLLIFWSLSTFGVFILSVIKFFFECFSRSSSDHLFWWLSTKSIQCASLPLEGVHHVHGSDCFPFGMFTVRHCIADYILKEHLRK